jgi:hypothetical protein
MIFLFRYTKSRTIINEKLRVYFGLIPLSRIELDERVITQMLGLPDDVKQTAKRLRYLLANETSIYSGKGPILPVDE